MKTGIILGIHKNSPDHHFVVLGFIREKEHWPPLDPERQVAEHKKTGSYKAVWFQETVVPEFEKD
jgi:hypothetical protein